MKGNGKMKYYHVHYRVTDDFWDDDGCSTDDYITVIANEHPFDWALERSIGWKNNYDRKETDVLSWKEITKEEYDKYIENNNKKREERKKHKTETNTNNKPWWLL